MPYLKPNSPKVRVKSVLFPKAPKKPCPLGNEVCHCPKKVREPRKAGHPR